MSDNNPNNDNEVFEASSRIEFDLGLLINILKQSWIWMILIVALSGASAYTYIHYTAPEYESSSIIQIISDNQANRLLNVEDIYQSEDISKDIELLRSEEFFKRVVESLDLGISYYTEGQILTNERFRSSPFEINFSTIDPLLLDKRIYINFDSEENGSIIYSFKGVEHNVKFAVGDTIELDHLVFSVQDRFLEKFITSSEFDENNYFFIINSDYANLLTLTPNYRIDLLNASAKTIRITVTDFNPSKATEIANAIAEEFMIYDAERKVQSAKKILTFINDQLGEVYTRLKDSESSIRDFKKENRLADRQDIAQTYIARLNELETEKSKLEVQVNLLLELKKNIDKENTGVDINQLMPVLAGTEFESKVEQQIIQLQNLVMRRNNQLTSATTENPTIIIYDQQIESQKTLILRSLDALEGKFKRGVRTINNAVKEIEQNFIDLPSKEIEYARIERVYNSNEKYYTLLLEKKTEYAISEAGFISENRVLRRASTSRIPISPLKPIIYASFLALGFILSFLLIGIRYILNNDISGVHDLSRLMNPRISLLGVIPKYSKNIPLSQLIIDKNPKSIMAEAFRTLRTKLDFFQTDSEKKIIAVTSTISGEGKTFVAINLGGILAFSDKKVIILDLDMRKPRIHKGFNSTNEYGMSTYLSNRDNLKDIIRKSELDGLHFITAGPIPPNPSELIISGNLTKGLDELKKIYDIIIIDNPPVGLVTDGIASLKLADYPIYIFRNEYSKKSFIDNINQIFIENKITNLSAVLNSVDLSRARYGSYGRGYGAKYGYGYGYGYTSGNGYYSEDNEEEEPKLNFLRNLRSKLKNDDN